MTTSLPFGRFVIDLDRGVARAGRDSVKLGMRECRLLAYLSERQGRTVPREELLEAVWEYHPLAQTRAMDTAIARIRSKLEQDPKHPRHLVTVYGEGYRFVSGEAPAQAMPRARAGALGLPRPLSAFVGRAAELQSLLASTSGEAPARLVTLHGPSGAGKSRMLVELGHRSVEGTVTYVDAHDLTTVDALVARIAEELQIEPAAGTPLRDQVRDALAYQKRTLLLLDGCERIASDASRPVCEWLAAAPQLRVVATTHVPFDVDGEQRIAVGPMSKHDAIELLRSRARASGTLLGAEVDPSLDGIAARVDRLPLALELAAARLGLLAPAELEGRLSHALDVLAANRVGAAARHKTLYDAIRWTFDLLGPAEADVLLQCTAFEGPFSLEAAEAVLTTPDGTSVIDAIARVRDGSLLAVEGNPARFRLLTSIREFASRAIRPEVREAVQRRHAAYFLDRAEGHQAWWVDGSAARLAWLADARGELLAIRDRFWTRDPELALRAVGAMGPLAIMSPARSLVFPEPTAETDASSVSPTIRARAALVAAIELYLLFRYAEVETRLAEVRTYSCEDAVVNGLRLGMEARISVVRDGLGRAEASFGQVEALLRPYPMARCWVLDWALRLAFETKNTARIEQASADLLAEAVTRGWPEMEWRALRGKATAALERSELEQAESYVRRALAVADEIGSVAGNSAIRDRLIQLLIRQGRLDEAAVEARHAAELCQSHGARHGTFVALNQQGLIEAARGRIDEAAALFRIVTAGVREIGATMSLAIALGNLVLACVAQRRLDEALSAATEMMAIHQDQRHGRALYARSELAVVHHARGDLEAALAHYDAAQGDSAENRARIQLRRGLALSELGRRAESEAAYAEAEQFARSTGHRDVSAALAVYRGAPTAEPWSWEVEIAKALTTTARARARKEVRPPLSR